MGQYRRSFRRNIINQKAMRLLFLTLLIVVALAAYARAEPRKLSFEKECKGIGCGCCNGSCAGSCNSCPGCPGHGGCCCGRCSGPVAFSRGAGTCPAGCGSSTAGTCSGCAK